MARFPVQTSIIGNKMKKKHFSRQLFELSNGDNTPAYSDLIRVKHY